MRFARILAALAAVVMTALGAAAPAMAQTDTATLAVTLSPPTVVAGNSVTISVAGCPQATATASSVVFMGGSVILTANGGTLWGTAVVAADAAVGPAAVTVTCGPLTVTATLTVIRSTVPLAVSNGQRGALSVT